MAKIPVILDTDIGSDIDDTWALAFLLRSPELDLKLVTTATPDAAYRARIAAKLLESCGRADVAVGIGRGGKSQVATQEAWVAGYDLARYPGTVHQDGVGAIIETIMTSPEPVTLAAIGPLPNVAAALAREPDIAGKARFVGMQGSIAWSHHGDGSPRAEWNVKCDPLSCQRVFAAPWDKTITPLDTCGRVRLTEDKYRRVAESEDPLARMVIENYRAWKQGDRGKEWTGGSSVLFDTVAVYLCFTDALLEMKQQGVRVDDEGFTRVEEGAPEVNCALAWKDLGAFEDLLVARLTEKGQA